MNLIESESLEILIVCSSLGGGGAERVAANLANTFTEMGNAVTVFCRKSKNEYAVSDRVRVVYPKNVGVFSRVLTLASLYRKVKFDVVISFTDVSNIDAFLSMLASGRRVPRFPTIHSDLRERDSRLGNNLKLWGMRLLHSHACRSASKTIVVSEGASDSLCDYYSLDKSKVVCIHNPVIIGEREFEGFVGASPCQDEVKLVAAGRLVLAKNYRMMIDVVERLNNETDLRFSLDIYGEGELQEDISVYATSKGMSDFISLKGFSDNLSLVLPKYDIFILTSDWEGFGNVLVEALVAGLRVVATDCPSGPKEVLGKGAFGLLVKVGDVEAFSQAVITQVKNPLLINPGDLEEHLEKFRDVNVARSYLGVFYSC